MLKNPDWRNMVHLSGSRPAARKFIRRSFTESCKSGRVCITCRKGMPVSDKIITVIFVLELHPVLERSDKIPDVDLAA